MIRSICAIIASLATLAIVSCSDDSDNSELATLTAEMCDVSSSSASILVDATTDAGERLLFTSPLHCSWAEVADSTYRAMLYYNKVQGQSCVEPLMADKVLVLMPHAEADEKAWTKEMDPLGLTASWMAENGRYLNLRLTIKTGTADDKQKHSLGIVCDTIIGQGRAKHYFYRLCHSQNGLPEFYSFDVFASVPTDDMAKDDTLSLTVPTYKGLVEKLYVMH